MIGMMQSQGNISGDPAVTRKPTIHIAVIGLPSMSCIPGRASDDTGTATVIDGGWTWEVFVIAIVEVITCGDTFTTVLLVDAIALTPKPHFRLIDS